jgi:hypothetical protein
LFSSNYVVPHFVKSYSYQLNKELFLSPNDSVTMNFHMPPHRENCFYAMALSLSQSSQSHSSINKIKKQKKIKRKGYAGQSHPPSPLAQRHGHTRGGERLQPRKQPQARRISSREQRAAQAKIPKTKAKIQKRVKQLQRQKKKLKKSQAKSPLHSSPASLLYLKL